MGALALAKALQQRRRLAGGRRVAAARAGRRDIGTREGVVERTLLRHGVRRAGSVLRVIVVRRIAGVGGRGVGEGWRRAAPPVVDAGLRDNFVGIASRRSLHTGGDIIELADDRQRVPGEPFLAEDPRARGAPLLCGGRQDPLEARGAPAEDPGIGRPRLGVRRVVHGVGDEEVAQDPEGLEQHA